MMSKKILFVDCCIRGNESRTKRLADAFFSKIDPKKYEIRHLILAEEDIKPLVGDFFWERQSLLEKNELSHPRFDRAREFADADAVVIAAPFWDLQFPALLKIYIENITIDGITFGCSEQGICGLCKGSDLVFLTTRGGFYAGSEDEQGSRYIDSLHRFFGFDRYHLVFAEGLDADGIDTDIVLQKACKEAEELALKLFT